MLKLDFPNKIKGNKKKILFVTGTRADFGKLKGLIESIKREKDFDYGIFATGMHLLKRYGSTIHEIRKSGFVNIYPFLNQDDVVGAQMDYVLANTINGLSLYTREFCPDLIVVHGDRVETLAGATVGVLNNILVAHIEGGEISGTIDEILRHAITKLSHIHFVANNKARKRLIQLGETPKSIFVTGSPDIDLMLSKQLPALNKVKNRYRISFSEYAIFSYHPVTTELRSIKKKIATVIDALIESNMNYVVIYPNNDRGSDLIVEEILRLKELPRFRLITSMRFEYYLTLLKHSKAIIGNSSAGVREAPVYGVPTVNIGTRQNKRFNYKSIINVSENRLKILEAIQNLPKKLASSKHFGKGNSAELFIKILKRKSFWNRSCQKTFRDI
ncbi:MAG: UDP-N-acetylglucosamine 2-epimerase (hydrolyzing) [Nitrosomonadaceae bacterium]|nr:UDP-N-acetylglucosamine 2-epimerase (hydrolyzing) [Nitrosomonadaceae bacterium]